MLKLKTNKKDEKTKLEAIRAEGLIPAVVYGPKQEAISFSVKAADFNKLLDEAGESTIISLEVEGEEIDVLIHDVQFDAVTENVVHADFYAVERGKKLQIAVGIVFEGEAPAEKNLGAMIMKVMHEVEIESMPRNLPSELTVDLSVIENLDSQILAKDIKLPEGVELITPGEEVVALAKEAKEEEEEPVEALDMDSIEVEQKGKGEEAPEEGEEKKEA